MLFRLVRNPDFDHSDTILRGARCIFEGQIAWIEVLAVVPRCLAQTPEESAWYDGQMDVVNDYLCRTENGIEKLPGDDVDDALGHGEFLLT